MTPEEKQQLNEVYNFIQNLKASSTIPYDVDGAFRDRFKDLISLSNSTKLASSENQSVNEGGSATYNVLKSPDGFIETSIAGSIAYIPKYN